MPGLIGFTNDFTPSSDAPARLRLLAEQQRLISFEPTYVLGKPLVDAHLTASYAVPAKLAAESIPYVSDTLRVWLQGEINNADDLASGFDASKPATAAELFARLVDRDADFSFLPRIDGVYNAVVYDATNLRLHFLTDRYGLDHLYYTKCPTGVAWACEIKAFLPFSHFNPVIDEVGLADFFSLGYLCEDRTWFRDAKLFPAAAHWVWDLRQHRFTQTQQYWSYDSITSLTPRQVTGEVIVETASRFREAVRSRAEGEDQVGVALSGGLDSRVIFAVLAEQRQSFDVMTLGKPGCDDIAIAQQAMAISPASRHQVYYLDADNWLGGRREMVWALDGHLDLLHMHFTPFLDEIDKYWRVHLSGFLGDATIGGSYLDLTNFSEQELFLNRGRRFVAYGVQQGRLLYRERLPFFDNQFFELAMSVPAALRRDSQFYFKVLKELMPPALMQIPWQSTGIAPGLPRWRQNLHAFMRRTNHRMGRMLGRQMQGGGMTSPGEWLRAPAGQQLIAETVGAANASYHHYLDQTHSNDLQHQLSLLPQGGGDVNKLTRAMTLEIWLQEVDRWRNRL